MAGQILDEGGRCLDDISIQPKNPGGTGSDSRKDKTVPGTTHRLAACLLVLHFVPLLLILRGERRLEILPKDADTREPRVDRPGLCLANSLFECRNSRISIFRRWRNEPDRNELMRVAQPDHVVPVFLVKPAQWREDKDPFTTFCGSASACQTIEVVVHNRRRSTVSIIAGGL